MYISLLPVSLLVSFAAAATTISAQTGVTSTTCAAQPVMDACYASTSAIAQACSTTDYGCLCSKWNEVLICFNQCPNDPRYASTLSTKQTHCNNAAVYGSSTTSAYSAPSASPTATGTGSTNAQTTESNGAIRVSTSTSATASAASPTNTKNSAEKGLAVGAGSVLMGVAGLMGALL